MTSPIDNRRFRLVRGPAEDAELGLELEPMEEGVEVAPEYSFPVAMNMPVFVRRMRVKGQVVGFFAMSVDEALRVGMIEEVTSGEEG